MDVERRKPEGEENKRQESVWKRGNQEADRMATAKRRKHDRKGLTRRKGNNQETTCQTIGDRGRGRGQHKREDTRRRKEGVERRKKDICINGARLLKQQMSITVYRLPTNENKLPFPFAEIQTEVCRFRVPL